jgi:cbb3-type cytochrome oxidase subunit 1
MQGLMGAFNDDGADLHLHQTIARPNPIITRLLGGTLFLTGMFVMAWNRKTMTGKVPPVFLAAEPAQWGDAR